MREVDDDGVGTDRLARDRSAGTAGDRVGGWRLGRAGALRRGRGKRRKMMRCERGRRG
jgi:hypothetical protein